MARRRSRKTAENKYADLQAAQAELDFHDRGSLTDKAVHQETLAFVTSSARVGHSRVRIIVGKGLHSANGPRVGPQVRRTLRGLERAGAIEAFQDERVDRGGSGAIVVRLS